MPKSPSQCRVCHCTENNACRPPCSWAEPGLCTLCSDTVIQLLKFMTGAVDPAVERLAAQVYARMPDPRPLGKNRIARKRS